MRAPAGLGSHACYYFRVPGSPIMRKGITFGFATFGLLLTGCPEPEPSPCDDDPLGCAENEDFTLDADCSPAEQMGELDVVLGEGEKTFVPLGQDQLPSIYFGGQGGQHMLLGARVSNLNPGRERAQVVFSAYDFDEEVALRPVEIPASLWESTDLGHELYGMLVVLSYFGEDGGSRVRVDVTDACGRTGFDERIME